MNRPAMADTPLEYPASLLSPPAEKFPFAAIPLSGLMVAVIEVQADKATR